MFFDRTYGVEIEAMAPLGVTRAAVADALTAAGVPAIDSGYSHARSARWKVVPDGSLTGGNGLEVVSPPLRGEEGMAAIRAACRVLGDLRLTVNKSCGLHVHVAAPPIDAMRRLAIDYANHEPIIDGLLPSSRRGNANFYAQSMTGARKLAIAQARDTNAISNAIGHGRYAKVNFQAFWRHGTVEFRHHSGTVDGEKVCNWTKLMLRLVDAAAVAPIVRVTGGPDLVAPVRIRRRHYRSYGRTARRYRFVQLVTRPEGATREEVWAATGWGPRYFSFRRFAADAGLTLRSRRMTSGRRRYWATEAAVVPAAPAPTAAVAAMPDVPVAVTLETWIAALNMPADEAQYWINRRAMFAANGEATL